MAVLVVLATGLSISPEEVVARSGMERSGERPRAEVDPLGTCETEEKTLRLDQYSRRDKERCDTHPFYEVRVDD